MFLKLESISTIDFKKFEKRGELLQGKKKSECADGRTAVYQNSKGQFFEIKNFLFDEHSQKGMIFEDGTRLFIEGWMKISRVGGKYQLYQTNSYGFSFCHGIGRYSLQANQAICDEKKLELCKEINEYYLVDQKNLVIYMVEEYFFDEEPKRFNILPDKSMIVVGYDGGIDLVVGDDSKFFDENPGFIINPMAAWLLQHQYQKVLF